MPKQLIDLNNQLFDQLEKLSQSETKGEVLKEEIERSKALCGISDRIIDNANLALKAHEIVNNKSPNNIPAMLGIEAKDAR